LTLQDSERVREVLERDASAAHHASGNGAHKGSLSVLFVTTVLGGGGAEKHLLRVANHLDRERFRVSLALVKPEGEFESALADD